MPYNETNSREEAQILIKSWTYGRILGGGSSGTSFATSIYLTTSRNFLGSNLTDDSYDVNITIDIENSTTASTYAYDVNLLGGGSTTGNTYGNSTINIKNGTIGRVLGGSIGDSSYSPRASNYGGSTTWNYPLNTYMGSATINMTGGEVTEFYGGCLGRNMSAIGSGTNGTGRTCDSYFYGTININIMGGTVKENIYGAGARWCYWISWKFFRPI